MSKQNKIIGGFLQIPVVHEDFHPYGISRGRKHISRDTCSNSI